MTLFWQLVLNGLVAGALYAMVAVGFALIFGATHHFHIAHAAVINVAAYLTYVFTELVGLAAVPSIILAVVAAVLAGVAIMLFIYVPVERSNGSGLTIFLASLGMLILIENAFTLWLSPSNLQATFLQSFKSPVHVASGSLTKAQIGLIVVTAALFAGVMLLLRYSRLGQEIRALANNPDLVRILGRSPKRIKAITYAVASLLAALVGVYQVGDTGISPGISVNLVMFAFVAMVAGTVGSIGGAFIVAVALGLLQNVIQFWVSAEWATPVVFILFLILIVVLPGGIAPLFGARGRGFKTKAAGSKDDPKDGAGDDAKDKVAPTKVAPTLIGEHSGGHR